MKYLIDTNIIIWCLDNDKRISDKIRNIIKSPDNIIFVSTASLWEIVIKKNLGKLNFPDVDFAEILKIEQFEELPINLKYLDKLNKLPPIHGDPFDRMIISQAQTLNIPIITSDKKFPKYDVEVINS